MKNEETATKEIMEEELNCDFCESLIHTNEDKVAQTNAVSTNCIV